MDYDWLLLATLLAFQAADPTIADLQTIIQYLGFTKLPEFLGRPQLIFEIINKDLKRQKLLR